MIIIQTTKKLYSKLPVDADGLLAKKSPTNPKLTNNPLSGWHADLVTLQRRNCVLLTHNATSFPLFLKGLVKADYANFQWHFEDALLNTLLKVGANQQQLDNAAALVSTCQFDTETDYSSLVSLRQMNHEVATSLWTDDLKLADLDSYRIGAWLTEIPRFITVADGPMFADKEMLKLLSKGQTNNNPRDTINIVQLSDYRIKM